MVHVTPQHARTGTDSAQGHSSTHTSSWCKMGESNQCHDAATLSLGKSPGQVWTDMEKTKSLASTRVQTLDCTAHNKSQYQLHYCGIHFNYQLT